ncbi:MAG: Uma2 family endonuclease [Gemmataceae bacterium]|nr:Uma2 family endonuclease [Gemmataceae bacterium]
MSTLLEDPPATAKPPVAARPRTLRDLLRELGDIDPARVRLIPPPGTATIADLLKPDNDHCELIDGTLVEKAVGNEESFFAFSFGRFLNNFVTDRNLGWMTGEAGFYELDGGRVRGPDIAFVSWDRSPGRRRSEDPIPLLSPDLVVEVLSPSNTRAEMDRKRGEYFRAGVRLVWEVDPRQRTVRVYTNPEQFADLTAADTLSGEPVLPGFTLPLAQLFAELDRHG